jgi:hypothetical protein
MSETIQTVYEDHLNDDEYWDAIAERQDVDEIERVIADLKQLILDIDEERVLRRAEWDEYRTKERPQSEYREAVAEYSRWKADTFMLARDIQDRRSQLVDSLRNRVGEGDGPAARTIIRRLVEVIRNHEREKITTDELNEVLDTTWLVASGRKWSLREFSDASYPW